jgi:hypothetical protein
MNWKDVEGRFGALFDVLEDSDENHTKPVRITGLWTVNRTRDFLNRKHKFYSYGTLHLKCMIY